LPNKESHVLEAKDILRLSHQLSHSGHWYLRLSDDSLYWSPEVFRLYGESRSDFDITFEQAMNRFHPEDREWVRHEIQNAIATEQPMSFEARIVRHDGAVRQVEVLGEVKRDADDPAGYLFGIIRDITDRHLERTQTERLAWILENTSEMILLTDINGRITWINRAFERTTGFALEEAKGHKPGDLLQGPDSDSKTIAFMREKIRRNEAFTTEVLNYTKSGRAYWVRIACQPEREHDGTLRGFTAIESDITEEKQIRLDLTEEIETRKRLEQQLRHMATHDEMTGLPNRRHFIQKGAEELERARRHNRELSVLIVDLDLFKEINDRYGHSVGDEVLRAFAGRCRNLLRESDLAARIGGEEFAVLLPETNQLDAFQAAERLQQAMAATPIETQAGPVKATLSIGVATLRPGSHDIENLLQAADKKLYEAKDSGRNRVCG